MSFPVVVVEHSRLRRGCANVKLVSYGRWREQRWPQSSIARSQRDRWSRHLRDFELSFAVAEHPPQHGRLRRRPKSEVSRRLPFWPTHCIAEDMDLDAWLTEHIGCEQRRAEVRANVDCLSDFRVASLEDLEDALGLAAWPALPKKRFLDARRLKEGEDEAAPSSEPQRPRSAPVSAAELAAAARGPPEEEDDDDDEEEEDVSGRTPSRRGQKRHLGPARSAASETRSGAASPRSDAVAAFPDLRGATMVGKLIKDNPRKRPRDRAPADIRERFEAQRRRRRPRSPKTGEGRRADICAQRRRDGR